MGDPCDCPTCETYKHKLRVSELLTLFIHELHKRAIDHDSVKLESPEREAFDAVTTQLKGMTFNSSEYNECKTRVLGDALKHHYARCRHHPEHFADGINDMTLIDLVEFLADCKAASERHNDGNIMRSIDILVERFDIAPQLARILRNTVTAFSLKE